MSEISHCNKCNERMIAADHRDESVEQDGMCISCREHLEQCREEEATQSFCEGRPRPIATWYANILTGCGFKYESRRPVDINETCHRLTYSYPGYSLEFMGRTVTLQPANKDWCIEFYVMTPEKLVLSTIKAAIESK